MLLTPAEVAVRLGASEEEVLGWLRAGKLPGARLGRLWRVREQDLRQFVEQRREQEAKAEKRRRAELGQKGEEQA